MNFQLKKNCLEKLVKIKAKNKEVTAAKGNLKKKKETNKENVAKDAGNDVKKQVEATVKRYDVTF